MSGNLDQEMYALRHQLVKAGVDLSGLRRFAVQESEAREFVTEHSDQPAPRPGIECDIHGLRCTIVPDQPNRNPND